MEPTKVCVKCSERRPMSRYGKNPRMNGGYEHVCKDCKAAQARARRKVRKSTKHCYRCRTYKDISEYDKKEGTRDGYATTCRTCEVSVKDLVTRTRMKVCTECKRNQQLGRFSKHKKMLDGHESVCKDCRAVREKKRREKIDPELVERRKQTEARRKHWRDVHHGRDPFRVLRDSASVRAKKADVPFTITIEDLFQMWEDCAGHCPVSGQKMTLEVADGQKNRSPYKASLDRIVPDEGYTLENSRLVCWQVNAMKHTRSDEDLLRWCQYIVDEADRAEKEITSLLKKFK